MGELINGRTPEEIKRGLRWIAHDCDYNGEDCSECECVEECHKLVEDDVARDALALIEHFEAQQPKWISVKERLPWMNQKVLVSDGGIVTEAHYNGRGEWIHNGHDMEIGGVIVTHWMPLPQPPEEE